MGGGRHTARVSKHDVNESAKEFQREKGDTPDTNKQFSKAEHQAKNDYQDAGSPFGELSNRDRSSKQDVPDKIKDEESE